MTVGQFIIVGVLGLGASDRGKKEILLLDGHG